MRRAPIKDNAKTREYKNTGELINTPTVSISGGVTNPTKMKQAGKRYKKTLTQIENAESYILSPKKLLIKLNSKRDIEPNPK